MNRISFPTLIGIGLVLRLVLAAFAIPYTQSIWFVPFLTEVLRHGIDPWTGFLAAGGDPVSFPYGPPYLVAFAPLTLIGAALDGSFGAHFGLTLSLLGWELLLMALIGAVAGPGHRKTACLLYWLSPVTIYVGYWHGQLDVFPAALLTGGLYALAQRRFPRSGQLLGAAVAAKLSMALAAPFVGLYLLGRQRLRPLTPVVLIWATLVGGLLFAPAVLSPGFRTMVLKTPEAAKAFSLSIGVGPGLDVYLLPLAYLVLVYWAWRVRRLDFELLWSFTGVAFMALLLLTPASPGWVMWAMPFLVLHTARARLRGQALYWPFAISFVLVHLMVSTGPVFLGRDLTTPLGAYLPNHMGRLPSVLMTVMLACGVALAIQMVRGGILRSPFHLATRKPFAVAVAGDSGAGKDTLVDAVTDLFGPRVVTRISGDDYHVWDRQKPMWRALTHLNPKANDLEAFASHVTSLIDGRIVHARQYDHASGRSGEPVRIKPGEVIAVSGLHALWSPALTRLYDVRIFMDMDEDLRRFLKLRRDVGERGHAPEKVIESIERRSADGQRFIQPQAAAADLVLRLEPRHPSAIADLGRPLDVTLLRLVVVMGPGRNFDVPARLLTSLCGMQVIESPRPDGRTEVLIEGEPTAEDIAAAAARLAPAMREFIDLEPKWASGLTGVMQLLILIELDRSRRRRGLAA